MGANSEREVVSVVGARPQFVKLGALARACSPVETIVHRIVHTGQHYDELMSDVFFDELEIPRPDLNLDVGSGGHGAQTGAMLAKLETAFESRRPDAVIVYGDTNSTLAATLAATKLHIPVVHVEAGLRSFDRHMPEEVNRLVADHCSDRLYAPTSVAMQNLTNENLQDRAVLSGDVMRDVVLHSRDIAIRRSCILSTLELESGQFAVLTVHRPVNTTKDALSVILTNVLDFASGCLPVVFSVHPRTRALVEELISNKHDRFHVVEPVPFLDMISLLDSAAVAITDSGGLQKEAAFLGTPCITLRDETEWTETVDLGVNQLAGQGGRNLAAALRSSASKSDAFDKSVRQQIDNLYGNGTAANTIVTDLLRWLGRSN